MTATETTDARVPDEVTHLWRHVFGGGRGLLQVWTAERVGAELVKPHDNFFNYPGAAQTAATWALEKSGEGREVYFCAHLLDKPRRIKENAAQVFCCGARWTGASPRTGI